MMENVFDQFDGGDNVFDAFDTAAPEPKPTVTMEQAKGRTLPPLWDADVLIQGQPIRVRGVFDKDANAYLVGTRNGAAYFINKNQDGSLGLLPYQGKPGAADPSSLENFKAGAGKAVVDTKRGIKQLGALAGNTLGLVGDETVDSVMADAKDIRSRDADLMNTKAGLTGDIAGSVATAIAGGSVLRGAGMVSNGLGTGLQAFNLAPRVGQALSKTGQGLEAAGSAIIAPQTYRQAAAAGAGIAGLQPASNLKEKGLQIGLGTLGAVGGQAVANGIGHVVKGARNAISEGVKNLADKAEARGINIRADQLLNSKPMNALSSALDYVPFSGSGAAKAGQQKQFNSALAKTIGEATDNPAEAIRRAQPRLSEEFDIALRGTPIEFDDALKSDFTNIMDEARATADADQLAVLKKQIDAIVEKVDERGAIDGPAAYAAKKRLDLLEGVADSTKAHFAGEIKKALMSALQRSMGPEAARAFADTRRQYANLMALRKLTPRGAEPDISPARLANMRGYMTPELNELANIGATFLKAREGNSGTAQKELFLQGLTLGGGGMGAYAGLINPKALAAGLLLGRGTNKLLESQLLKQYLREGLPNRLATPAGLLGDAARAAPAGSGVPSLLLDQ